MPDGQAEQAALESPALDAERRRLADLYAYDVLDSTGLEMFETFAHVAATLCGTPWSQVNFVDAERQVTVASQGLEANEIPREASFCARTIVGVDVMVVEDATADERFAANPLVVGDPHIRFYAGVPVTSEDGRPIGALCVIDHQPRTLDEDQAGALRSLSQLATEQLRLRRLARQEMQAAAGLAALRETSEQLTHLIVHDLRAPLTAIRGCAELVQSGSMDPSEAAEIIGESAVQLEQLVDGLLTPQDVVMAPLDLAKVVRSAIARLQPSVMNSATSLGAEIAEHVWVKGDEQQLARVVDNLLSNALKYTPNGRVTVVLSASGAVAVLEVADTGIGIADDEVAKIFDTGFRATTATAAGLPGSGFGLASAKAIADAHGASFDVTSGAGRGTRVRLCFPLAPDAARDG